MTFLKIVLRVLIQDLGHRFLEKSPIRKKWGKLKEYFLCLVNIIAGESIEPVRMWFQIMTLDE